MSGRLLGLLAEFADAGQLRGAVLRARRERYADIEAYSPYPVDGLAEAIGVKRAHVPFWMLLGAIGGGGFTYWLEWYSATVNYPINVGGRPPFSWPAFLPPALEMTLLWAVLLGVLAMLVGNRLPRVHHPLFAVRAFDRATGDRFFMLLCARDPHFEPRHTREFLQTLSPLSIGEVLE
ncbi:MAG: DUF3341 domain-containing protein [Rhodanobacteraceae bacterium]